MHELSWSSPWLVLVGLSLMLFAGFCFAQGTQADYDRMSSIWDNTRNTVRNANVETTWSADGSSLLYVIVNEQGRREFIRVDCLTGEKSAAIDSTALSDAAGREDLDVYRIEIDDEGVLWVLAGSEDGLVLATVGETNTVELRDLTEPHPFTMSPATDLNRLRSGNNGSQVDVTFINQTQQTLTLVWVDGSGERRPYGTVEPGQTRTQNTYAGHAWLALDSDGQAIAGFTASSSARVALILPPAPQASDAAVAEETVEAEGEEDENKSRRPSPDERYTAIVEGFNVRLYDSVSDKTIDLTTDGAREDGYRGHAQWSPDGRYFVVNRVLPAQEHTVHFVESSPEDQLQPRLHSFQYLKPGDVVERQRPVLFDVETNAVHIIDNTLFDNPFWIRGVHWTADSSRFFFYYNQRGHQTVRLIGVDVQSAQAVAVVDEVSETFVNYSNKTFIHHLEDANQLIWMSERSGWNHLYRIDRSTGSVINAITQGDWLVREVVKVDEENQQLLLKVMGVHPDQSPYHIHFARVNFDGTGLTLLTDGDGMHDITFSPNGDYFVDTYSRADLPPVRELRRTSDGRLVSELVRADASALLATGWQMPERFVAKARDGETDIHGLIYRPSNFDPSRTYPVIENIYAGPHGQHVPIGFNVRAGGRDLTELGFIVVRIDGMGTNWRSKAFHDVCWRNIGDAGFPDRVLWIQAAAQQYPYMDDTRVGIYGTSAGGQNAMRALIAHGDFYSAAVADCGCHDNRMDKIWWNEAWMGWPVDESYALSSNVDQAHRMQGHLMLMVGEMDRNVDPASTMQVANALIEADKDFDLVVFPGGGHGSMNRYGWRRLCDFFVRHLHGVEPRSE